MAAGGREGDRPSRRGGRDRSDVPAENGNGNGNGNGPEACSGCRARSLTRLPMVLTDGTAVVFVSCQACERREWFQPGADGTWTTIPIDSVLARSTRRR